MAEGGGENTAKLVDPLSAEKYRGAELHDSEKHDDREHGKDEKFAHLFVLLRRRTITRRQSTARPLCPAPISFLP
jgi:hypothetical protein